MLKSFCAKLRQLRGNHSQAEIAKSLGLLQQTYARWEQGIRKPDIQELTAIAIRFGVSSDWLLGLTEKQPSLAEPVKPCAECLKKDEAIINLSQVLKNVTATKKITPAPLPRRKP